MIQTHRTTSQDKNFVKLVRELDADLAIRDGKDHAFYDQFNQIDNINHVIVATKRDAPLGCGAMKPFDSQTMEVKRMFTRPDARGKGVARQILAEIEEWAQELGYKRCTLETGKMQPEAIQLYQSSGYAQIPNYGPYKHVETSICFEKVLS